MQHPILITITVLDFFIFILLAQAGIASLSIITNWNAHSNHAKQLKLERRAESADLMVQWAFTFLCLNVVLLILAITQLLPQMIPGAMCAMGVMQALGDHKYPMLILRFLAFGLLYWHQVLVWVNYQTPCAPLTAALARLKLLVLVFFIMAAYDNFIGLFFKLNSPQPVSCCAVLYDALGPAGRRLTPAAYLSTLWPLTFGIISILILMLTAGSLFFKNDLRQNRCSKTLAICALGWVATASISLIFFFSSYIYQVLDHHCPFCFFLPEHYGVGFLLFGLLLLGCLESPVPLFLKHVGLKYPELAKAAKIRCCRMRRILIWTVIIFGLFASGPAIIWRLRFGVWI